MHCIWVDMRVPAQIYQQLSNYCCGITLRKCRHAMLNLLLFVSFTASLTYSEAIDYYIARLDEKLTSWLSIRCWKCFLLLNEIYTQCYFVKTWPIKEVEKTNRPNGSDRGEIIRGCYMRNKITDLSHLVQERAIQGA